jgi:hypothetical protein
MCSRQRCALGRDVNQRRARGSEEVGPGCEIGPIAGLGEEAALRLLGGRGFLNPGKTLRFRFRNIDISFGRDIG